MKEFVETFSENRMEINNPNVGIITAGMPYNYAKEVFPDYSYLKLGMVYPLPEKLIRDFSSKVKKIYVVEELDPFLEDQIKAMGIKVIGKEIFPYTLEFDPGVIKNAIEKIQLKPFRLTKKTCRRVHRIFVPVVRTADCFTHYVNTKFMFTVISAVILCLI